MIELLFSFIESVLFYQAPDEYTQCIYFYLAIAAVAASGAIKSTSETKREKIKIQNRVDSANAQEVARQRLIGQAIGGNFLGQFGVDDIFGTKAEAIDPIPVDEALSKNVAQIGGQGLPAALDFTGQINQQFSDETLRLNLERINTLNPQFQVQSNQAQNVTTDLLFGRLPFQDVADVVSDRASIAGSLGTPGTAFNATLKDLGLTRLNAMETGFNMFSQFQNTLQSSVSQTPNFARADQILPFTSLTANQRVTGELLTTQALQNAANIRAEPDPGAAQLFNAEFLGQQNTAATRTGTRVANTTAADAAAAGASAAGSVAAYQAVQ